MSVALPTAQTLYQGLLVFSVHLNHTPRLRVVWWLRLIVDSWHSLGVVYKASRRQMLEREQRHTLKMKWFW